MEEIRIVRPALPTAWRLLRTPAREAAWNMALDHALAEGVGRGAQPILRFYAWEPAAVSVGYNQPLRVLREALGRVCRDRGLNAVRRPTGGRAVLHAEEVTYSVIAPFTTAGLTGGVRESCARIHRAILLGLASLGITDLSLAGPHRSASPRAPLSCFATKSRTEIAWRGRKLVGSAQRRLEGVLLQHGSILLSGDQSALEEVWPGGATGTPATIDEAGGRRFAFWEVADAIRGGFEDELSAAFKPAPLDPALERRVRALVQDRYGSDDFLYRI